MTILNHVQITEASNNRDYLNITLADIIVTWYNASGVAIGNTELLNEIESLYGLITIEDLVDNDVIVTTDITATKEDIKQAIGFGSASVPYLRIDHRKLRQYLGGLPIDEVANKALTAMFSWENNATEESIFEALGIVVGNVVNLGKIGYNVVKDTLVEAVHNLPLVSTLKDVYNNFTNSTYFQELILNEDIGTEYIWYGEKTFKKNVTNEIMPPPITYDGNENYIIGMMANSTQTTTYGRRWLFDYTKYGVIYVWNGRTGFQYIVNLQKENHVEYYTTTIQDIRTNPVVYSISTKDTYSNSWIYTPGGSSTKYTNPIGCILYLDTQGTNMTDDEIGNYCIEHWRGQETSNNGVTDYINKTVGNITKQNYLELTANIGNGEYMFVFNKYQYDVIINQITNNTTNGEYTSNGPIITNYNTTYIQQPTTIETRPTYIPAPTGQPIQPFISPRPTPIPEETEEAIYNGGIAESIKDKFPFCIPWDIQALVNGLWSNNRQAPYIHWDARFGSWGKLGEVTIDLQPYDTAAQIFRSTTLLLWIIGLVVLTRNMIGS